MKLIYATRKVTKDIVSSVGQKGSFSQNFTFVFSSRLIVTAVTIATTPILTRIYSPDVYGVFALFNALLMNADPIVTWRLPNAFALPKNERVFLAMLHVTVLSTLLTACIVFIVFLLVPHGMVGTWMGMAQLEEFKYLLVFGIVLYSFGSIFSGWIIRENAFRQSSTFGVVSVITSKSFNVAYGVFTNGNIYGLIFSEIIQKGTLLLLSIAFIFRGKVLEAFRQISWVKIKYALRKFKDYPLKALPAGFIGSLGSQIPIYLLLPVFGTTQIGLYTFALSMLDLPHRFIGERAISPLLFQKLAASSHTSKEKNYLVSPALKVINAVTLIGVPVFTIIMFLGPLLFGWVFGSEWYESGKVAAIMAVPFCLKLLATPSNAIIKVVNRLDISLHQSISIVVANSVACIGGTYFNSFELAITLLAILRSVVFVFFTLKIYYIASLPLINIIKPFVCVLLLSIVVSYSAKLLISSYFL